MVFEYFPIIPRFFWKAVWNSNRVAVSLSADPGIMGEGLMGKELSEKPDAIENLTEFLLSI